MPTQTLNELKSKFNESQKIIEFIAQRKERLKNLLAGYTHLPRSLQKEYTRLNKTIYYYRAQVEEFKGMINDAKKMERSAISLMNKIPAFQKFMKENSQLASLFNLPGNNANGDPARILAGLQTRASIQGMIQQRIAAGGPNAMTTVHQNLSMAQAEMNKLKEQIAKSPLSTGEGVGGEALAFKPNTQKTKPFLKRLEYGFNVQFSKNNSLIPSSTDLALMLGYKMNDKGVIGIGASYKLGLGNIQHISLTSRGVGFRSYIEWKAPAFLLPKNREAGGGLYITGGYEMNYNTAFKNIEQLKKYDAWQKSALLGISKKVGSIPSPFGGRRKGAARVQLLYDFLARKHVPVSQPVIFRMGYDF